MATELTIEQDSGGATATEPEFRSLNAHDRCDHCGHQAYVLATKTYLEHHGKAESTDPADLEAIEQELLFCGHHHRHHESALQEQGWTIHNQTHSIPK